MYLNPIQLLESLEAQGYRLRAKDGRIFGPPGLTGETVELIREHRETLVTLITFQCPRCHQPVRRSDGDKWDATALYVSCTADPLHFSMRMPRALSQPEQAYLPIEGAAD